MTIVEEVQKGVQNILLVVITSVILAITVNILALDLISFPHLTVLIVGLLVVVTIWILIHFSGIKTDKTCEIRTLVVYDKKTGEITHYPRHIVQDIIRQAVEVVSKHDATLIQKIINPPSLTDPSSKERSVFTDFAELILLHQVCTLLAWLPDEYDSHFEELKQLPSGFMDNSIIKPLVTDLRGDRDVLISMINNLDKFKVPTGSTFEVTQNPNYVMPDYRRMILSNRYIRITIDYRVSGLISILSMSLGPPVPEIGHLPINPYFINEAMKKYEEHGLWTCHFYYHVKMELINTKLCLMALILNIPSWSRSILTFLSFGEYFIDNIDKTPFGSIDINKFVGPEKEYWEHEFTIETMWKLKNFLKDMEKKDE